jgi:DNA polymerase III subunit epsilon
VLRRAPAGWLAPEDVAEARLVGAWIAAHDPPALELRAGLGAREHAEFVASAT